MDVFALRKALVNEYEAFARSFTKIRADDIRQQIDDEYALGRFWPEPLIQINPRFQQGGSVKEQVEQGLLHPACARLFDITLYRHQVNALALARSGKSYVVTTGTGSGKSLCFFLPIVDAILRVKESDPAPRTRAIIIYPMNALANSQREELTKYLGDKGPVTFARYTGQEDEAERERIKNNPPDILLTNFMMLELLMTRQDELDQQVMKNCAGLQFLVLDELHTYRGRQGADVAMLVRRVRERLASPKLQCIGTSATMVSGGTQDDSNGKVAGVASKLFATSVAPFDVVTEDLDRATNPTETATSVAKKLALSIKTGIPEDISDAQLRDHPLAIWVETTLGIVRPDLAKWIRAKPLSLREAAEKLAADSGVPADVAEESLKQLLLIASRTERDRMGTGSDRAFFAFKLHQFISGAGVAYATLGEAGERKVVLDGQQFLPGDEAKRLYSLHFCRNCGQEYHPVRRRKDDSGIVYMPRDIDDMPMRKDEGDDGGDEEEDAARERLGYLTPISGKYPLPFHGRMEDYPETWIEQQRNGEWQLKKTYASLQPERASIATDGRAGSGHAYWFMPGKFRFCLNCSETHGAQGKDVNRLSALSAEGRSSATTLITSATLRWMYRNQQPSAPTDRKLLAFTDNRQDAALQAGHFNDFIFVALLRAAVLRALQQAGHAGLGDSDLGAAIVQALGFDQPVPVGTDPADTHRCEWLRDPAADAHDLNVAQEKLRQVLAHRAWFDQRRGWRFTNPNLEQLGLLEVDYIGLGDFCRDNGNFVNAPELLRTAKPDVRETVLREIFNYMRRGLAVDAAALDGAQIDAVRDDSLKVLRYPWGFGREERPARSRWLQIRTSASRRPSPKDEDFLLRGGGQTPLGLRLRDSELWGTQAAREIKRDDFPEFLEGILKTAKEFVRREENALFGAPGYRLNSLRVRFRLGSGEGNVRNNYYSDLYQVLAVSLGKQPGHVLMLESREHTAQVDGVVRGVREKRFRYTQKDREQLKVSEDVRKVGESDRFLPLMICSPTMELGVDISSLNTVFLRNMPPTPANYVQRAGRAGRSGQAALVVSYCAARSPHDQYFFRDPRAMVHGEVRPPIIELANRDLVTSHLQAVWLGSSGYLLSKSIAGIIEPSVPGIPVRPDVLDALKMKDRNDEARLRAQRVLEMVASELNEMAAPWFTGATEFAKRTIDDAPREFDKAFQRWRDLFLSAEIQRDLADKVLKNYTSTDTNERREAKFRQAQAQNQIDLLLRGQEGQSSDFYTYRYLATEGFLPGYNFPRLPLMAYVPASRDGGRDGFLQRPRFLALSEFGPRSLVYHEGRAYRVVRARIAVSGTAGATLATRTVRVCRQCGAGHFNEHDNTCHSCNAQLADAELIFGLFKIDNVDTEPTDRITANDEDRQRQGFELQTVFEWAIRQGQPDKREVLAEDGDGEILSLRYGPSATITRINKGMRRRKDITKFGFGINPQTGRWSRLRDEDEAQDEGGVPNQRIVPFVQDQKNALLLQLSSHADDSVLVTLQHAIKRGIEAVFQLEESELLAEPVPDNKRRTGVLYYEATEGGAGVLTQLVTDPVALQRVARAALRIMHLDVSEDLGNPLPAADNLPEQSGTHCVVGCYRCLLSYYNQTDHERINRRLLEVREILVRLGQIHTKLSQPVAATGTSVEPPKRVEGWIARWFEEFEREGSGLPRPAEATPEGVVVLHWANDLVAVALPDTPRDLQGQWEDRGYTVVRFGEDTTLWPTLFAKLKRLLGL